MKKGSKIGIVIATVVVAAGVGLFAFRVKLFPSAKDDPKDPAGYTTVKVSRGELTMLVAASGQFEPNTITTIRPDANMPTRKIVRILVTEGQRVKPNQALVQIDATGLDLDLKSAEANYQAQKVKLDNVKAKPAGLDLAQAEVDLAQAKLDLQNEQENYDNLKALADKGLAAKNQLNAAERQLAIDKVRLEASQLSYQNVKAQSQVDVIQAQESALAQADNERQKAKLVFDAAVIRSPEAGVVAEVLVKVGDLVSPSTAIMTVVNPDPMILQAQVNENDMELLKIGNEAAITPSGFPDLVLRGRVTKIDLRAQVQSNVSVFTASIEVPNRDGKLLWGMNADAEISVLAMKNVLTLPSAAVHAENGSTQVNLLDEGKVVAWEVQTGASDGSKTQIVAGLDEGQEVVMPAKNTSAASGSRTQNNPQAGMGQMFRVLH